MKKLGVERIISVSAVGSLREEIAPGHLVVPDQFIDRTTQRPSTFFGRGISRPCESGRSILQGSFGDAGRCGASRKARKVHAGGTYVCMEGPQFSTRAESHLVSKLGRACDRHDQSAGSETGARSGNLFRHPGARHRLRLLERERRRRRDRACSDRAGENVELAQETIRRAVATLSAPRTCACASALKDAIITERVANSQEGPRRIAADYREIFMSVLVVGTVAFDSIETPFGSAERILGGSASYFALGASFFAPVRVVGVIGKDFPQDYLDLFAERKIDIAGISASRATRFTGAAAITKTSTARYHRTALKRAGRFRARTAGALPRRGICFSRQHRSGHADGSVGSNPRRMKLVVCDTMDHWIRESQEELKKVLKRIEMLVDQRLGSAPAERLRQHRQGGAGDSQHGAENGADQARRIRRVAVFRLLGLRHAGLSAGGSFRSDRRRRFVCRRASWDIWRARGDPSEGACAAPSFTVRSWLRLPSRISALSG